MSLLNKISGFAQKAKENVVSKSVISKDRRLEQSLSETIKVNEIYFEKMSTYGLPSVINVIAFDCVSGLLAIAGDSNHNYIKIFGKGISTLIKLPTPTGIKHLQFKSGFPILVVIDKVNRIMTIDLRTKSIRRTLQAKAIITCQTYCTGTDWLFIGYSNGCVDVFDIMQGIISPYQIPDLLLEIQNEEEQQDSSHIVVDLQMHPSDLNTLLIGYESHIFLWNIRENIIQRSFTLRKLEKSSPYRNANLTCFAWSPNGSRFIAGYDDGCTHLWDIKNENKPIISRKLSKAFFSELSTSEDQVSSEPIYQIAWYTNETVQKSYILIAGGIPPAVIQGLHILEFNLGNETKEASKQSIMPLPVDLSHFLILSSNPYYLGMHNPFGIAIIGIDHCLRTYSLDYGFPPLKLPPALEFINPKILSACHIPQLPINSFKKLTSWTHNEKMTRYLPITGGVTGPEHVYHIESNDLLITIHQGEIVKFWDASYTALRPLSYLTIACLEDIDDRNTILYCLDINKRNGTLLIGFSDGSILVYEYQENLKSQTQVDSRLQSRNEEFINSCDDTLKEISELLEDMETTEADVEEHLHEDKSNTNTFVHSSSLKEQTNLDTTNPFLNSPPTQQHQTVSSEHQTLSADSIQPHSGLPIFKKINKQHDEKTGFFATLKITLCSPIKSVIHLGEFIIAAATDDGQIYVIDIDKQLILFSHNITQSDYQNNTVNSSSNLSKADTEANCNSTSKDKPASITTLKFFNTYSSTKAITLTTQLYVSLSNGHIYQFDLSQIKKRLVVTPENVNEFLAFKLTPAVSLVDMHIIDLQQKKSVVAFDEIVSEEDNLVPIKKTDTSTSSIESSVSSSDDQVTSSNSTNYTLTKRIAAIGKADYRHQENPHLIIFVSTTGINVCLSGCNIKLFSKDFNQNTEVKILKGEIVTSNNSVCLCLLSSNGKLSFYSLPTLEAMLEMNLPSNCQLNRLQEAYISSDGRIIFWTGAYELEQYSFIPKPDLKIGESVFLFDPQRAIPPHPSNLLQKQQQRNKKSWLDTLTNSFQKEPLTLNELDLLMGRVPAEDPNEIRRQKVEAYKATIEQQQQNGSSIGSNKGLGSVFSQLGEKMNERGEKLDQLDKKFQDMNTASGDFLKAIKDYNERQARKKWWEF